MDIEIQSVFTFMEGTGEVIAERNILNDLHGEKVTLEEYFTGAFGTTEYQSDMPKMTLGVDGEELKYSYLGRKVKVKKGKDAYAVIPDVCTKVSLRGNADELGVEEGIAFSPVYHLSASKTLSKGGLKTWLSLTKAN